MRSGGVVSCLMFTAGFFLGAMAVSSLVTAGVAWLGLSAQWQVGLFAASSMATLFWVRPVFVKLLSPKDVATNTDALVGKTGTVIAQVPAGGIGRVRLANEEWRATSSDSFNVGDSVQVLGVEGSTLTVSRA